MALSLDTNVLIWLVEDSERLGPVARQHIDHAVETGACSCSVICFWEIGLLLRKKRLGSVLPVQTIRDVILSTGIEEVPLDAVTAMQANDLPGFHADPADRLIVASALVAKLPLMTSDRQILGWEGPLRTIDARL